MSLSFPHKSDDEIRQRYNAIGLLWGVPVYINVYEDTGALTIEGDMAELNWVPRPLYLLAAAFSAFVATV